MKVLCKTLIIATASALLFSTAAFAYPSQPGIYYQVTIYNKTNSADLWEYHHNPYEDCSASPNTGSIAKNGEQKVWISCAYTAQGEFTFNKKEPRSFEGKVNCGFGLCTVISQGPGFRVAVSDYKTITITQ